MIIIVVKLLLVLLVAFTQTSLRGAAFERATKTRAVPRRGSSNIDVEISREFAGTANLRTKILDFRGFD